MDEGSGTRREFDPELRRISHIEPATLAERLAGCLARRALIDTQGGRTEILSRVWLFAQGRWWLRPRLGPGRSWVIYDEAAGQFRGRALNGRHFETPLRGLRWAERR